MELEKAKSLYIIAKNNLERAEKELDQKRKELKPEIENAYTFGHDQGVAFEKYITVTIGIHLHREVFKRAKQALMEHYKKEFQSNDKILVERLIDMDFELDPPSLSN